MAIYAILLHFMLFLLIDDILRYFRLFSYILYNSMLLYFIYAENDSQKWPEWFPKQI